MYCPTCQSRDLRVKETRAVPDTNMTQRRRKCVSGHEFWTCEIPMDKHTEKALEVRQYLIETASKQNKEK